MRRTGVGTFPYKTKDLGSPFVADTRTGTMMSSCASPIQALPSLRGSSRRLTPQLNLPGLPRQCRRSSLRIRKSEMWCGKSRDEITELTMLTLEWQSLRLIERSRARESARTPSITQGSTRRPQGHQTIPDISRNRLRSSRRGHCHATSVRFSAALFPSPQGRCRPRLHRGTIS